jgi:hypothetical protein
MGDHWGCRHTFGIKTEIAKTQPNQFLHTFLSAKLWRASPVLMPSSGAFVLMAHRPYEPEPRCHPLSI